MTERDTFGLELKRERERRNVTLSAISESTKIKVSVLAALERGDFSRWPEGIFRRGYLRAYATAIGLPPEPIVAEFTRLFPDADQVSGTLTLESPETTTSPPEPTSVDRLTLRVRAAAFDAGSVLLISGVLTLTHAVTISLWLTVGIVGLGYLLGGTLCLGGGIGMSALSRTDAWFVGQRPATPQPEGAAGEPGPALRHNQRAAAARHDIGGEGAAPARRVSA
jgi:transcriptional regulator with XRE-family HTH domain